MRLFNATLAWTALSGFGRALAGLSSLIPTPPCSGNTALSESMMILDKAAFPETASWALTGVPSGKQ